MIKKSQVKEWEILDVSDPAKPKQIFKIVADDATSDKGLEVCQSFPANPGTPWHIPPALATEYAQALTEAAASITPPVAP